ncbi:type VI secretion system baseplate subunit TssK [Limnoglobus roseus]|uniref:Type VI secretion system baseplate subunit TssK n=1 Tax=Limnoglobus roseus TaxID=2598579 RepID=A0A5C1AN71_9BACT|nr:type VI secretion system baseplate subunit TssK [Limnoglobus roseus]QEL19436.1 type VI secretion system baseplate subunit TssK [Limnoglobus roseus]
MTVRSVHWHEGMFLHPHHFQAAGRHAEATIARGGRWDSPHNWGYRTLDLDLDAIANHRFAVRALRARLRDGTQVDFPDDIVLSELDLKPALENSRSVTILLAVPVARPGRANASAGPSERARYQVETVELEDENTGVNPLPIEVRLLNAQLMFSTSPQAGYEVLPVARVMKSARADAPPQLDPTFIPPLLASEASPALLGTILRAAYDRVGTKIEVLGGQVTARSLSFDSRTQGDLLILEQLRELNAAAASLSVLAFTPALHPFPAYAELCQIIGRLAIFGPTRRLPPLPRYDHDDLGGCFWRLKQLLDELLDLVVEPAYKERAFVGAGLRMQVVLEPAWVESGWSLYVGVECPLSSDDCVRLLSHGQLDMKLGSSERVDAIFRLGQAGLKFEYRPSAPKVLPDRPGQTYFQIASDPNHPEWQNLLRSLTLALRVNEHRVVGSIQGEQVLTIRMGADTVAVRFTLFAVPQPGKSS